MGSNASLSISDYDYTVVDSRGIRGVKDGKEFPITEEEYRRKNPYHKDIGCTECSFVQDKETLLLWVISREAKEKATSKPSFIGKFTMPDWTGHSSFYLFRCKHNGTVVVDYPHGYTTLGSCYLRCVCGAKIILTNKEDYERDNIAVPLVALGHRERYKVLVEMFEEVEKSKSIDMDNIGTEVPASKGSRINFWNVGLVLLAFWALVIFIITQTNWRPF